ncbi:GNAT family N-acetyltransferase, partial [Enterococcus faecalis]|nr:GNAT family N-acetyltransferase [Enterococcus faecalis]
MENLELVIKDTKELLPLEFLKIIKERVRVFVVEQNCAYQEVDDKDDTARHVYFKSNDKIVAYARITLDQNDTTISFGRVLVVKEYR